MGCFKKLAPVVCALALFCVPETEAHSAPDLLFSYHFAGTSNVVSNPDAAKLKQILELPETIKLRDEVLEKLARTPEQFLGGSADRESESAKLFLPLLQSLVGAESLAEVRRGTNGSGELVFAVRLKADQARLWDANLQKVVTQLGKGMAQKTTWEKFSGWEIKRETSPNLVRAIWTGDWLVVGVGGTDLPLQNNMLSRLAIKKAPMDWKGSTNWLEAVVDFPRLQGWLPIKDTPLKLARTEISLSSRADTVRSLVRAVYPEALNWKSQKWQVPTNIIRDPLVSFTAAQNVSVLLSNPAALNQTGASPLTNQFYVWSYPQFPLMTYGAMPVKSSEKAMEELAVRLPPLYNAKLEQAKAGKIIVSSNRQVVVWAGLSMLAPALQATNEPAGEFILGSLFPSPPSKEPPPSELLDQFLSRTNVIYYDWEITHQRVTPWQMLTRAVPSLGPQRPQISPELMAQAKTNAAIRPQLSKRLLDHQWQSKVGALLGNTTTEVTLVAPNEVQLLRKSDLGFTSLELIYLSHWLNHPDFPLFRKGKVSAK